jgi:hypothetical protein
MSIKYYLSILFVFLSTAFFLESVKIISLPFRLSLPSPWGTGTWNTGIGALLRSSTVIFLYDIVNSPVGLLLPAGLIAFAIYRLVKSEPKPIIESIILIGIAIILFILKFNLITPRQIGLAFWPIILVVSILMFISARNNRYN